jgi:hypothetical protein
MLRFIILISLVGLIHSHGSDHTHEESLGAQVSGENTIRFPDSCATDCQFVIKWEHFELFTNFTVETTLVSAIEPNSAWTAIAFSKDQMMVIYLAIWLTIVA